MSVAFELNFLPGDFPSALEFDFDRPETEGRYQAAARRTKRLTPIKDVRGHESDYTLFRNGFQYVQHFLPAEDRARPLVVMTEEEIGSVLVPHTEELVMKMTGATKVLTAGYRLRNLADDPSRHLDHHGPSHNVHCDFSSAGAMRYLEVDLLKGNEPLLLRRRVLVVNVWRPLRPITRDPLAICDWQSIVEQPGGLSNLVPWKVSFANGERQNESLKSRYHASQRWCYLNHQLPSEPLVFLCFDSARIAEGGMTVPHSAFVDPAYANGEPRCSFEIKLFCFLDE